MKLFSRFFIGLILSTLTAQSGVADLDKFVIGNVDACEQSPMPCQIQKPALIAYQKLIYAGSYTASEMINGFLPEWLMSITASGKTESDLNEMKCE